MRVIAIIASLAAGYGCGFSGGSNPSNDASVSDAPPVDACDPLTLKFSINGGPEQVDVNPDALLLRLGDSIVIDGSQACGLEGAPTFAWDVPAAFAGDTGTPDKRIIKIAPITTGTHFVDLEITDSAGSRSMQLQVETRGIEYLPYIDPSSNDDDCDGLALTTGNLFVVCNAGIHQVDLADPHAPAPAGTYPNPQSNPQNMNRVAVENDNVFWLIDSGDNTTVFRYDVGNGQLDPFANGVTGVVGDPRRLEAITGGVRVATNNSVWSTIDSGANWTQESIIDAEATAESAAGDLWSGDNVLVHISAADTEVDVFAGDDDNIRTMVFAGDELWVGGDEGAALITNGQVESVFTTVENLRGMVVDPITGDIWAGSNGRGLYRFSRELDRWLRFSGGGVGLTNDTVEAVVVDNSGDRDAVYMATNTGLFMLTTSFTAP